MFLVRIVLGVLPQVPSDDLIKYAKKTLQNDKIEEMAESLMCAQHHLLRVPTESQLLVLFPRFFKNFSKIGIGGRQLE